MFDFAQTPGQVINELNRISREVQVIRRALPNFNLAEVFLAEITGNGTPTAGGTVGAINNSTVAYTWSRVFPRAKGSFDIYTQSDFGTLSFQPAFEITGNAGVPNNTVVLMFAGYVGDADATGLNYLFSSPVASVTGHPFIGRQIFTASGTYTPTAGTHVMLCQVLAGGGGGGGCVTSSAGNASAAGGGGGASYSEGVVTNFFAGGQTNATVTIGAGGTGGAAGGFAGNPGTLSRISNPNFGVEAEPGSGGTGDNATHVGAFNQFGGQGGTAGTGDIKVIGNFGALSQGTAAGVAIAGAGGSGVGPYGGAGGQYTLGIANNGHNYGSGGSGGASDNGALVGQAGGNGAPGVIVVWEFA